MPNLLYADPARNGQMMQMVVPEGQRFTVGRGKTASLRVRDLKMSRVHYEICISGGIAIITDLGSMNGTHVNGHRVATAALNDGDAILAGYTTFTYRSAPPGAAAPPKAPKAEPESPEIELIAEEAPAPPPKPAAKPAAPPRAAPKPPPAPEPPPDTGPDDRAVAAALHIVREVPERRLKKGEMICASCRQPVTAKEFKSGAATNVHGQVCCPRCIEADPLIGEAIAGYQIDAKLGSGMWSNTYKAEQLSMARAVVLRVLRSEVVSDAELVTQFLADVKRGGQISHPNLVRIYDIGRTDELCYVSGEFIDGESVRQLLAGKKGGFAVDEATDIAIQIAGAVDVAHRREVYHRDIRPSNVVLNDEGIPKLVGLGFAKSLEDTVGAGSAPVHHAADLIDYWAPECLADPSEATRETDVYSLGAVLYAMVAGHEPFQAADPVELVKKVRRLRAKPLDALRNDVPHRLSAVVAKAMAKNPDDRYPDCQTFIRDLRGSLG